MQRIIAAGKAFRQFERQGQAPPARTHFSSALANAGHVDLDRLPSPISRVPDHRLFQECLVKQQKEHSRRVAGGEEDGRGPATSSRRRCAETQEEE